MAILHTFQHHETSNKGKSSTRRPINLKNIGNITISARTYPRLYFHVR